MIPAGITTATAHLDAPVSFIGDPGRIHIVIAPSVSLVWTATGTPLGNFIDALSLNAGVDLDIELPHTDQAGFEDGFGNAYTNWHYTITVVYEKDGRRIDFPAKDFQIPTGQTLVDLALIPAGEAAPIPVVAPILPVTSIDGFNGAVTKTQLGISNVTNTSDANKPVSILQQAALDLKAPVSNPTFTGTVAGVTKAMVGLGSVDNTADAGKPVSTAQATAIALKLDASQKAAASGVAPLDAGSRVPQVNLPAHLAPVELSATTATQVAAEVSTPGKAAKALLDAAYSPTDAVAEASPLYQYGHSFGASPGLACTAGKESFNLLGARLKSPTITSYAKSGSGLFEICYDLAAAHTAGNGASAAGSQWPVGGRRGVVILDCETNNCTHPDASGNVQALPAGYTGWYTLALRSVLALMESAARVEDNDAAVTVSGTWLTFTSDLYSGGSIRRSNTANAYMDIPVTVPAGVDHVWLMAYAQYEGSTFEVSVDGGAATAVTQPGLMPTTRSYRYANFTQIITGPSTVSPTYSFPQFVKVAVTPGAHTVRMKRTDTGAGYVFCDGLLIPATKPPLVITFLDPLPGTVGTRAEVVGRTQWIANKALLDPIWSAVSAEFPNVRLLDNSDMLAKGGVSQNTNDSLHPNDRGMAIIAAKERAIIAASGDPDGLYVTL